MIAPLIGMHFLSFLILLILSAFAAAVLHWGVRYQFFSGLDGFIGKWIVAWICGWLGPAVFGHWFGAVMLWNVYIIPGLIGAFVGAFIATAFCKAVSKASSHGGTVESIGQQDAA
jgi:uncharacterized membrane protein YeaQ/YmgE (transglycosylase-associated protein family)